MSDRGRIDLAIWNLEGGKLAVACLLCACLSFSIGDVCFKYLSGSYSLQQVVVTRTIIALAVTVGVIVPLTGGWGSLATRRPLLLISRGLCVVVANLAFFSAVSILPLADVSAVFFVAPLLTTTFSVVFLRERVGVRRWLALAFGMLGVILVVRPGSAGFQWPLLLPLVAAISYATFNTITRKTGMSESAPAMALYMHMTFFVTGSAAGLWLGDGRFSGRVPPAFEYLVRAWQWPDIADAPVFFLTGVVTATGAYFVSQAYRIGEASLLSPFEYVTLVLAVFWGFSIFGEVPSYLSAIGIALILGSGIFMAVRGAQVRQGRWIRHLLMRK